MLCLILEQSVMVVHVWNKVLIRWELFAAILPSSIEYFAILVASGIVRCHCSGLASAPPTVPPGTKKLDARIIVKIILKSCNI